MTPFPSLIPVSAYPCLSPSLSEKFENSVLGHGARVTTTGGVNPFIQRSALFSRKTLSVLNSRVNSSSWGMQYNPIR